MKLALSLFLVLSVTACAEDATVQVGNSKPVVDRTAVAAGPAKPDTEVPPPVADLQEAEFVESDRSRDPFRSFAQAFVNESRGQVKSQREVVLEQYAIEELKLVGIIGGIHPEKAMLVDPTGVGHVVQRGQFVGRATVVQPAGGVGAAYEVNWRVDRIRDGDLVLVRDDPSNPEVPSSTRVIQLRTDDVNVEGGEVATDDVATELAKIRERLQSIQSEEASKKRTDGSSEPAP